MPPKRKSYAADVTAPPSKKTKVISQTQTYYTREELEALDHLDLVQLYLDVQDHASTFQPIALALLTPTSSKLISNTSVFTLTWSGSKINEAAQTLRLTVGKEIKKQMKWQPSCRTGTA
ncbi:hypothetical protein LTR70_007769 [Exophiala xenobiotica]|uniref:Uncharacterized protein n=1 Tax=Lithohypha guttulata TaxID=1690604 RepID=A0ABR0K2U2_9EURO|nr:hypothetical protein LTR24_007451 [Lithohypha guttulata]KAK5313151.1 hypothetical protein LTR70_007769 [Exophiala xenobiotica]